MEMSQCLRIEMARKMPMLHSALVVEEKTVSDFAFQDIFPFPLLGLTKPTRSTYNII